MDHDEGGSSARPAARQPLLRPYPPGTEPASRDRRRQRRKTGDRRRRGQSVVEFALILPAFLLLMLIAVDFGRIFFTSIQLNNAVREAANYGATKPTDT